MAESHSVSSRTNASQNTATHRQVWAGKRSHQGFPADSPRCVAANVPPLAPLRRRFDMAMLGEQAHQGFERVVEVVENPRFHHVGQKLIGPE